MGFMMKIIFVLLCLVSINTSASECDLSANTASAYYQLSHQFSGGEQLENSIPQLFELHRDNHQILQRNVSKGINDIWSQHRGRVSLTRAFDEYTYAIEYQPNELIYQPSWRDLFQLVVTPELSKMKLIEQKNIGCFVEQHYALTENGMEYQLVWLPNLSLVKFLQVKSTKFTQQWQLTGHQHNSQEITALFEQYSQYQSTDYADVGDNEGIAFLAAMINQGFAIPTHRTSTATSAHRHNHNHQH